MVSLSPRRARAVFMAYRPWQLARSITLAGAIFDTVLGNALCLLFAFWLFDTAAVISWMPWCGRPQIKKKLYQNYTITRLSSPGCPGAAAGRR